MLCTKRSSVNEPDRAQNSFLSLPGVRLHFEVTGDGPPLVLVHGGRDNLRCWWGQEVLADRFRVVRFDMRAHGATRVTDGDYSDDAIRRDLDGLLDALGIDAAAIVGYSQGAMVAAGYAATRPDRVTSLVLTGYGGGAARTDDLPRLRAIWAADQNRLRRDGLAGVFAARLARMFTPRFHEVERYRRAFFAADADELAKRPLPMLDAVDLRGTRLLVIAGTEDQVFPSAIGQEAARAAGGAFALVPGGHACCIEEANRFNAWVLTFLDSAR